VRWPTNLLHISHLPHLSHRTFYNQQRFTLNLTRGPMVKAGFSPSVRLFEAAACATPIISDQWAGLETFFAPGQEILEAASAAEVLDILRSLSNDRREEIGLAAQRRYFQEHMPHHRASTLERYIQDLSSRPAMAA